MARFWRLTVARRAGVAAALLAVLVGFGSFALSARAAPGRPAPMVTGHAAAGHVAAGRPGQAGPPGHRRRAAAPVIFLYPPGVTRATSAVFAFASAGRRQVTFFCQLDAGPVRPCISDRQRHGYRVWRARHRRYLFAGSQRYKFLAAGRHCFYVFAADSAGNAGRTARLCWFILGPIGNFTVGGNLVTPLFPGTSESLDLTFTNPGSRFIVIPRGAISSRNIAIISNRAGCAASNFTVVQGLAVSIVIPAHQLAAISLSAQLVPRGSWPVIKMIDTATNQDACQGATLTLRYAGIEAIG